MSTQAGLIDTSFFEPIIPLITSMRPGDRYISINIPALFSLDRDMILSFLEGAESKFSGGRFSTLQGTVKDQIVFDYLYQQYDKYNAPSMSNIKPSAGSGCNFKLSPHAAACDPNYQPIMDKVILDHYRNAQQKANRYREEIIFERLEYLEYLGFNLDHATQDEKEKFAKERLVFVKRADTHPDWRELYLYPEMTFIAAWWETVEFETFTGENYATMGKIVFGDHPKK